MSLVGHRQNTSSRFQISNGRPFRVMRPSRHHWILAFAPLALAAELLLPIRVAVVLLIALFLFLWFAEPR